MKEQEQPTVEGIFTEHGKRLYNLAYRLCGDEFLAEDLLQESLINIQKALPGFRGESSSYTWAYKVTLRTCLKETKGRDPMTDAKAALAQLESSGGQGDPMRQEDDPAEPQDALIQNALIAEIREKCHYFITFMLTEEQRVALLLKDLFDFSYKEMSYLLDVSEDVVRSRLSRARAALKRHFSKRCSWIDPENPCTCEAQVGFVLQKYPSLLKKLSRRTDNEEYNRIVARQISRKITSEDDIIASFPFLDFKGRQSLERILKNS